MGQIEVFEWLKIQRQTGEERFWSVKEIEEGIAKSGLFPGNGHTVWAAVVSLESWGYLEVEKVGKMSDFRRVYRVSAKYLPTEPVLKNRN